MAGKKEGLSDRLDAIQTDPFEVEITLVAYALDWFLRKMISRPTRINAAGMM